MIAGLAPEPVRVAIVSPIMARYDAISAAARDTYRALKREQGFEVSVIALRNDYADVPTRIVSGIADLLLDPAFLAADLIIYHFGIYSDLLDALIAAKGRARQIVWFHNITPSLFVPPTMRRVIERSVRQIANLRYADEIWADSAVNAETLLQHGIDPARIRVVPLSVDDPEPTALAGKAKKPLELLFIGRMVPSKGVLDLVQAIDLVRRRDCPRFRLRLAGNLEWSDPVYLQDVRKTVEATRLSDIVEFCGTVDDVTRGRMFHAAHILAIPSYHEGFCKPVIEALRSGCVPVGYAAYNLPSIASGFGRMVPPGQVDLLANALAEVMGGVKQALESPGSALLRLDRGPMSLLDFDAATRTYTASFAFNRVAAEVADRVHTLLARMPAPAGRPQMQARIR